MKREIPEPYKHFISATKDMCAPALTIEEVKSWKKKYGKYKDKLSVNPFVRIVRHEPQNP